MLIIKESLKLSRRLNCMCGWLEWLFDVKVNDWIIQGEWFPNDNFTFPVTDFDLFQQQLIAQEELGEVLGSAAAFPSPSSTERCSELESTPAWQVTFVHPSLVGLGLFQRRKARKAFVLKEFTCCSHPRRDLLYRAFLSYGKYVFDFLGDTQLLRGGVG